MPTSTRSRCPIRAGAVLVLLLAAGCQPPRQYVVVRAGALAAQAAALEDTGTAQLATEVVDARHRPVRAGEPETVFLQQPVRRDGSFVLIEDLIAGCAPDRPDPLPGVVMPTPPPSPLPASCPLAPDLAEPLVVRELRLAPAGGRGQHPRSSVIVFTALALGSLGGMVYCIADCESNKGLKSMGLGGAAALLGLAAHVAAGGTIRD